MRLMHYERAQYRRTKLQKRLAYHRAPCTKSREGKASDWLHLSTPALLPGHPLISIAPSKRYVQVKRLCKEPPRNLEYRQEHCMVDAKEKE